MCNSVSRLCQEVCWNCWLTLKIFATKFFRGPTASSREDSSGEGFGCHSDASDDRNRLSEEPREATRHWSRARQCRNWITQGTFESFRNQNWSNFCSLKFWGFLGGRLDSEDSGASSANYWRDWHSDQVWLLICSKSRVLTDSLSGLCDERSTI